MTILSLDPSSKCTGYAVFDGRALIEHGRFTPSKRDMEYWFRVEEMLADLCEVITSYRPIDVAVIEMPGGKQHRRRSGIRGHGQSVYGFAAGALWARLVAGHWDSAIDRIETVKVNEWTRGQRKIDRLEKIAAKYPAYDRAADPGGDAGDAIGLADWWLQQMKITNARKAGAK